MRGVVQALTLKSTPHDRLLIVDEDGWLWSTLLDTNGMPAPEPVWEPIRGPGDMPPFLDMRDRLDRLEAAVRARDDENAALRQRLDELPPIGGEKAE